MKESIYTYFDVGTILWMSYPPVMYPEWGYEESLLKVLRDDFFTCIELTQVKDEMVRKRTGELLAQSHMKVCYGAQPILLSTGLNPNDLDEEGRKRAEQTLMEGIDEAQYLGAGGIAFLAGKAGELKLPVILSIDG